MASQSDQFSQNGFGPIGAGSTGAVPSAARVGLDLRNARERLGWTLPALSAHLRIRLPFLEAIEDGRIADLPGNAYAVGFVRTYAQSLGLDPDEVARRFRAEAAEVNRKTELDFPAPVPERGMPALAVIAVGIVLAIGAYVGWYRMNGRSQSVAEMVQPLPARLEPLGKVTPVPDVAATPPIATEQASPLPAAMPADRPATGATPSMPSPAVPMPSSISPSSAAAAVPPPPVPGSVMTPRPDGARIVIRAKAEAWIQVRDAKGGVLVNRVLKAGDTWPVPPKPQTLLLTNGNPGGTEMVVDGITAPQVGVEGRVLRDFPLDADAIRDGRVATAVPPPRVTPHNQ